jgi:hypothetical protein
MLCGLAPDGLAKIPEPGVRLRAERLRQQLDLLQPVRQEARTDLLGESRRHHTVDLLIVRFDASRNMHDPLKQQYRTLSPAVSP